MRTHARTHALTTARTIACVKLNALLLFRYWNTWEIRLRVAEWLNAKIVGIVPGDAELIEEQWGPDQKCDATGIGTRVKDCVQADQSVTDCIEALGEDEVWCSCLQPVRGMRKCLGECWETSLELLRCGKTSAKASSPLQIGADGKVTLNKAEEEVRPAGARDATVQWYTWGSESDAPNTAWQGGRVDLNIANRMDVPITLVRYKSFETKEIPDQLGVIYPGNGVRFMSHEREKWVASKGQRGAGGKVLSWQVDIADGLVQDIVITG